MLVGQVETRRQKLATVVLGAPDWAGREPVGAEYSVLTL